MIVYNKMQIPWYLIVFKLKSVRDMVEDNIAMGSSVDSSVVSTVEDNVVTHGDYISDYMTCFMNGNEGCEVLLYDD